MLRDALERVMVEYATARDEAYAKHPLADFVRDVVPKQLASELKEFPRVHWVGSAGRGAWADAPWFGAFDPIVTETAQEGYYPVYLFTRSLDAVFLSLTQGMTSLRAELGTEGARALLRQQAALLRARLGSEWSSRFSSEPIDLQATGASTRLALYEQAHVFGRRYQRDALPQADALLFDLREMLRLYFLVTQRGGRRRSLLAMQRA